MDTPQGICIYCGDPVYAEDASRDTRFARKAHMRCRDEAITQEVIAARRPVHGEPYTGNPDDLA